MTTLTKEQTLLVKSVKQYLISKGLRSEVKHITFYNMGAVQEELISQDKLDMTYDEYMAKQATEATATEATATEATATEATATEATATEATAMEVTEAKATAMEAVELSESLEAAVLAISQSDMPIKPKHTDYLQDDGDLDFPAYKLAMDAYMSEVNNNKERENKRVIGNFSGLVVPIIMAVLSKTSKQGVYIGANGFTKWYDEPIKMEIPEGKTSHSDNTAAKPLLHVKGENTWMNKGALPNHILSDLMKTSEFKNKTVEWLKAEAIKNRQEYINALLKFNPEKYTIPA